MGEASWLLAGILMGATGSICAVLLGFKLATRKQGSTDPILRGLVEVEIPDMADEYDGE